LATHWLPWQMYPDPHEPQGSVPPQPSEMFPHCAPAAEQVVGVQQEPLAQTWPEPQKPQSRVPPQPSEGPPQVTPSAAHVVGAQQLPP